MAFVFCGKISRRIQPRWAIIALIISAASMHLTSIAGPDASNTKAQRSILVTTNDVIHVLTRSNAIAVIQFTSFGPDSASYRWRFRPAGSQIVESGTGQVRESYDSKTKVANIYLLTPKSDNLTTVRAGDIKLKWSYASTKKGWLYYHPDRGSVQILSSDAFNKDL